MAKGFFRKTLTGFTPDDDRGRELWAKHKPGARVQIDVSIPRNIKSQGLYWAMLTKLGQSIDKPAQMLHAVLRYKTGNVQMIQTKSGVVPYFNSTAFDSMDDIEFSKYLTAAIDVIRSEWLPHMSPSAIRQELEGMLAA